MKAFRWRRFALGVVVVATAVGAPAAALERPSAAALRAGAPAAPSDACGDTLRKVDGTAWVCTFVDQFSGSTLNREKWIPQTTSNSGFVTGEPGGAVACYLDDASTVAVGGGTLRLRAVRRSTPFTCPMGSASFRTRYAAGMVSTHGRFAQAYGRFEVRAKLPARRERGLQETLWLWPVDATKYGAHPDSGEIDFAEFYSTHPDLVVPRFHYSYDPATVNPLTRTNIVTDYCAITHGDYNTYALEWEPGRLTVLVNGATCLVDNYVADNTTVPHAPFDQPFMVVLTQALGHGTNAMPTASALSATTYVDYVKVWR